MTKKHDRITLNIDNKSLEILMILPWKSKTRLGRIRRNLFRELSAINKELKRHKSKMKII